MCQLCFLPVFLCCRGLPKWKRNFVGTPHPLCWPLARAAPHSVRPQCHVSPPSVGTRPSIGSKVRMLACCSKRSPRPSLVKVGNRMFQAFPMEVWSTLAVVNHSFFEALRGGERKSQRGRFWLASPAVRVAIVPLSIFSNPSLVVLVRARGAKRASR